MTTVIWPHQYDPKTSAIYALNDIDAKPSISFQKRDPRKYRNTRCECNSRLRRGQ
jgi:hypothetical protein